MKINNQEPIVQDKDHASDGFKPDVGTDALLDLVRLRVAQIRECPVGIEKHQLDLKARGESKNRLDQLRVWRESPFFSNKEKVALTLGETISLAPTKLILKQFIEEARHHFEKEELIALLLAILAVNDWNYQTSRPSD